MSNTPSLAELQEHFFSSIMQNDDTILPWVIGNGLPPERRMQIYRHIVENTLNEALTTSYPAIRLLVGDPFFDMASDRYMRDYPPQEGNLQHYGTQFSRFLASMPEAETTPYLADVARLEWARQEAWLAADAPVVEQLPSWFDTEDLPCHLTLHPSLRVVISDYRIFDIWHYCMQPTDEGLHLAADGQSILLWRDGQQIATQEIDTAIAAPLQSLLADDTFHLTAHPTTTDGQEVGNDPLAATITFLLANRLIADIRPLEISS